jgi:hypothetical protein
MQHRACFTIRLHVPLNGTWHVPMTVSERRAAWCSCCRSWQPMLRQRVLQRGVTPAALVAVIQTILQARRFTTCNAVYTRSTFQTCLLLGTLLARRRAGMYAILGIQQQLRKRVTAPQGSSAGQLQLSAIKTNDPRCP